MKHLRLIFLIFSILAFQSLAAQPTPEQLMQGFHWRNIGPANQGGRIVDIEALDNDFAHVWMATASGGVWKSDNAGTTWTPIFDNYETASIGDIAVYQKNPNILWVGTGEANNRNSTSWGNGIYKSTDGGKSFANMGLQNTHHIARVVTQPNNPDDVCVCASGHLWGYNEERGLYQTTDGGKSWQKLTNGLPNDGKTGCIDLVRDPKNPNTLYAAFYQRLRQPFIFESGGPNGGIFKSTNGGKSWTKLTNGLPQGPTGRIGLAIYKKNPNILMAIVEAEQVKDLSKPGSGIYRSEDGGKSWKFVNTYNNRPFYYSQIHINPHDDKKVYVLTTRFMVSEDAGKTFKNGSEDEEVHGDFHAMWLDPTHAERYYLGADKGISITHDHGKNFILFDNLPIGQYYRIGVDMRNPYYVYGGLQDNGFYATASFTRDVRGILNDANWKVHWGDGQFTDVDPTNWRKVYTSAENGSYNLYDPLTHQIRRISPEPSTIVNYNEVKGNNKELNIRYNWTAPMVMSPHDPGTLFVGGNYLFKTTNGGDTWRIISPDLSTNNPDKISAGKSGGITPDNTGAETHCAISTVSLSPIHPDIIWVGTDDGNVQLTRDGGANWTNVRPNIPGVPEDIWVSRLEASHFEPGTAYVTFDGHRSDRFEPWIFKTTDHGKSWTNLKNNLPQDEVVRVVREDLKNPNLLFIGTETGVFATINGGKSWFRFMPKMPTVSVYDLKIHPRDNDLIAGTHGRSIWIMDDITPLQQLDEQVAENEAFLFEQQTATLWENVSRGGQRGHFWYGGKNPMEIESTSSLARARAQVNAIITYYIGETEKGVAELTISDLSGQHKRVVALNNKAGIHRYSWDRKFDAKPYSQEELNKIEAAFTEVKNQYPSEQLERTQQRFKNAKTAGDQRNIIGNLIENGFPLDAGYGAPEAGVGTYLLTLKYNGKIYRQTLQIRADPLHD